MHKLRRLYNFTANLFEPPILIFNYHRIANAEFDPFGMCISPLDFEFQLKYLKEHEVILTPEEFRWQIKAGKRLKKRGVLITFDDGYQDTLQTALPLLKKYSIPAIFFISTGRIGTQKEFWWDRLARIRRTDIFDKVRLLSLAEKEKFISTTEEHTKGVYPVDTLALPLSDSDILKLAELPDSMIGAHSHEHPIFSHVPAMEVERDMETCKRYLENLLKRKIVAAAYPHGGPGDFTNENIRSCQTLGFEWAFTNQHGHYHSWSNVFTIPRASAGKAGAEQFPNRLKEIFKY